MAEIADAHRLVTRTIVAIYFIANVKLHMVLIKWFLALPAPTLEQAGFVTAVLAAVNGMLINLSNTYVKSGRRWNGSKT